MATRLSTYPGAESMPAPMVSIHCITFNHETFIGKALDSFLEQQTPFPVEIVVGEDCSSDQTRKIIETYMGRYPDRIRMVSSEANVGPAANFERTLKACRGKYVAICEGDDYWRDPTKLEQQVNFLEHHIDYVLCFHDAIAFDESSFEGRPQLTGSLQRDATAQELIRARPISTLTACFRNVVREIPPEIRHSPILDLCVWSLLGHYGQGKYLPDILPAAYRKHAGGLMSLQSRAYRLRTTAQAFLCLARYYERKDLAQYANFFTRAAAVSCGNALSKKDTLFAFAALADSLLLRPSRKLHELWSQR